MFFETLKRYFIECLYLLAEYLSAVIALNQIQTRRYGGTINLSLK